MTYNYNFKNGNISIEKVSRTRTQYEWFVSVSLTDDENGEKRFISLDRKIFITKAFALETTKKLLSKYGLI